ncbi:MAG TPA: molybdopterin-dependent oxidoreductase [Gammaproteobacteria bacterium]
MKPCLRPPVPESVSAAVKTTCPYCGVGCGVAVVAHAQRSIDIAGDTVHPANFGRLCSKGSALGETVGLEGRLLYPMIAGKRVGWDAALAAVASGFREVIEQYGPDAVALYVSGQLLTEDYYVANKLAKGFLGTANIDTNSRLCMSSAVAGYKRAFGSDTVPCDYADLEAADLIVLVGSNTAWCHPVVYQRIVRAKEARGTRIIVIDPRRTASCDQADLFLPLKPGTDTALFNGLLMFLHSAGAINKEYIDTHTEGYAQTLQTAQSMGSGIEDIARICELEAADIEKFYSWFAATERAITLFSQGVNQSSRGTDKVNAIINCHLATGRIGRTGMGPFSITGQPNAMGGREVGGLATQLAAHMDFERPDHLALVKEFWRAENMAARPGLKAVDMFDAIGAGKIKAVWIMATNPVVSLPDADRARAALKQCELVVVSDCMQFTDTTACADILLPATAWGEKDGTVTNSERRISRQRPFMPIPGEARHDWWIITQVAQHLDCAQHFPYQGPADIFREHAALSAYRNNGSRDFDIGALADISDAEYAALQPVQWPLPKSNKEPARLFADGRFFTANHKAKFIPILDLPLTRHQVCSEYPFVLNTGRIRDQWHTMTRSGLAPRLNAHTPEPFIQINPADAGELDIKATDLACIESRWGSMLGRVAITKDVRPGQVFAPIHWSDSSANSARVDAVVNPVTDPVSGEPEFKHTPVRVRPYRVMWHGFILAREPVQCRFDQYWVQVKGRLFWRYELAGDKPQDWNALKDKLFAPDSAAEWLQFMDAAAGRYRGVMLRQNRLQACIFIGPDSALPDRNWLSSMFEAALITPTERMALLAGIPADGGADTGRTVCSCFGVGINSILHAVQMKKLTTVAAIGSELKAGTNCGSCIPELKSILAQANR